MVFCVREIVIIFLRVEDVDTDAVKDDGQDKGSLTQHRIPRLKRAISSVISMMYGGPGRGNLSPIWSLPY